MSSCLHPVLVRYLDRLSPNPDRVHFDTRTGEMFPASVACSYVPCGKCVHCKRRSQNDWMLRSCFHSREHPLAVFATLTYNDRHLHWRSVPRSVRERYGIHYTRVRTLFRKDVRDWLKRSRLRYFRATGRSVTYFYVGEYGPRTFRPHYHIIMYGVSLYDFRLYFRKDWENHFGFVRKPRAVFSGTDGCFSYIGKYCCKPEELENRFVNLNVVEKPRKVASNNFGMWYLYKNASWHLALDVKYGENKSIVTFNELSPDGSRSVRSAVVDARDIVRARRSVVNFNGFNYALPRYYSVKLFGNVSYDLDSLAQRRAKAFCSRSQLYERDCEQRAMFLYYHPEDVFGSLYEASVEEASALACAKSLRDLSAYYLRSFC